MGSRTPTFGEEWVDGGYDAWCSVGKWEGGMKRVKSANWGGVRITCVQVIPGILVLLGTVFKLTLLI